MRKFAIIISFFAAYPLSLECFADEVSQLLSKQYRADESRILKSLQKTVSIRFKHEPLETFLQKIEKLGGFPINLSSKGLRDEGIRADEPVTIEGNDESLEQILKRVLSKLGLVWFVDRGVVIVTTQAVASNDVFFTRAFDVSKLLKIGDATNQDVWIDPIKKLTFPPPVMWPWLSPLKPTFANNAFVKNGRSFRVSYQQRGNWLKDAVASSALHQRDWDGNWWSTIVGNTLVTRQSYQSLRYTELVLKALEKAIDPSTSAHSIAIHEPAYAHKRNDVILHSLRKKIDCSFQDKPLRAALKELEQHTRAPIVIDFQGLSDEGIDPDGPVNLDCQQLALDSVLRKIVDPLKLVYRIEGGNVIVTTYWIDMEHRVSVIYRIQDLIDRGLEPQELVDAIIHCTHGPWVDDDPVGGYVTTPLPGLLMVGTQGRNHPIIEEMLAKLREDKNSELALRKPKFVRRSYSLAGLASRPSARLNNRDPIDEAIDAITHFVEPLSWKSLYPGHIQSVGDILIIEQTEAIHKKIEAFVVKHLAGKVIDRDATNEQKESE